MKPEQGVDQELLLEKANQCSKNGLPEQAREFANEAGLKGKQLWELMAQAHMGAYAREIEQRDFLSGLLADAEKSGAPIYQRGLFNSQRNSLHESAVAHKNLRDYYEARITKSQKKN